MTYQGTHFNDEDIMTMTRKQFMLVGGRGNNLTAEQLGECYDLIKIQHENISKSVKGGRKS